MKDKLMTAAEAARWVKDGIHLGVGAGMAMNPMPVIREIIRNGVRGPGSDVDAGADRRLCG